MWDYLLDGWTFKEDDINLERWPVHVRLETGKTNLLPVLNNRKLSRKMVEKTRKKSLTDALGVEKDIVWKNFEWLVLLAPRAIRTPLRCLDKWGKVQYFEKTDSQETKSSSCKYILRLIFLILVRQLRPIMIYSCPCTRIYWTQFEVCINCIYVSH